MLRYFPLLLAGCAAESAPPTTCLCGSSGPRERVSRSKGLRQLCEDMRPVDFAEYARGCENHPYTTV